MTYKVHEVSSSLIFRISLKQISLKFQLHTLESESLVPNLKISVLQIPIQDLHRFFLVIEVTNRLLTDKQGIFVPKSGT
jgi:hypothetical protein